MVIWEILFVEEIVRDVDVGLGNALIELAAA